MNDKRTPGSPLEARSTERDLREAKIQKEVSEINESIMDCSSLSSALLSRYSTATANLADFQS